MAQRMRSARAPKRTLLIKLVIAFVVPTASLFSLFAFFSYEVQREDLEAELGRRLQGVASVAATRLKGKYLLDLQPGDEEENLYYTSGMGRISQVRDATGVDRIYVFDRDFSTRLDTSGVAIGERQFRAEIDRKELSELFSNGLPQTSLLFDGLDGRPYKSGYAALLQKGDEGEVVLVVGVDAPAVFFDGLDDLRRKLILYGVLLVLAVAGVAVLIGLRITRPIRSLALAAQRIGAGDLSDPVVATSNDEIGLLAVTMETMRSDLHSRDERMQLMLAGIAHEVRNPLGGIELFSGILREDLEGDVEKLSHVARIEKEIGHLKTVVDTFLEYARRSAPNLQPVALHSMLREVADLEEALRLELSVELILDLEPVWCTADAEQFRRAILNLLCNAIQASAESDQPVRVKSWHSEGEAIFSIQNYGPLIDKDLQDRLFEPFFTTKEKGTGLGLAFVDEIIRDHGGSIELSSNEADGSCFTVHVPDAKPPSETKNENA